MPSPQPDDCVEVTDHLGNDLTVVNAARVSLNKFHLRIDDLTDPQLIKFLATNRHWTPFGHPQVQFRIRVPIFVARQWTKSMIGTIRTDEYDQPAPVAAAGDPVVNEVSRRYVDEEPTFFRVSQYRQRPDKSIKQGSGANFDQDTNDALINMALSVEDHAVRVYREMLAVGVAPEQARIHLPQGMMTEWIETGSLAYWARFCGLRLDSHAQLEIQEYARVISYDMRDLFPISWPVLMGTD